MSKADQLRAELALAELEEALVEAKANLPREEQEELRLQVREARQAYRENRGF